MGFFQSNGILNRRGFFGGAVKAFSPSDISGLQLWLDATTGLFDATSGGSAVTTDGSAVARWEDQSGNGRHFKQSTNNNRPVLKTSVQNSKNIIRFDAVNDFMEMDSAFSGINSACYFIVLQIADDPPNEESQTGHPIAFLYNDGLDDQQYASHYTWTDTNIYDNTLTRGRKTIPDPESDLSIFHLYNAEADSNGWAARINKNIVYSDNANSFPSNNSGKIIGKSTWIEEGDNYYFNGDLAEIVVYNSVLSFTDRGKVEDYLYSKWAIV
jgi:hypothetical protein